MGRPATKQFPLPTKPESGAGEKPGKHGKAKSASQNRAAKDVGWHFSADTEGTDMADKRSLGVLGFLCGGIPAAVALTAVIVVQTHLSHLRFGDASFAPQMTVGYR